VAYRGGDAEGWIWNGTQDLNRNSGSDPDRPPDRPMGTAPGPGPPLPLKDPRTYL